MQILRVLAAIDSRLSNGILVRRWVDIGIPRQSSMRILGFVIFRPLIYATISTIQIWDAQVALEKVEGQFCKLRSQWVVGERQRP